MNTLSDYSKTLIDQIGEKIQDCLSETAALALGNNQNIITAISYCEKYCQLLALRKVRAEMVASDAGAPKGDRSAARSEAAYCAKEQKDWEGRRVQLEEKRKLTLLPEILDKINNWERLGKEFSIIAEDDQFPDLGDIS
ncbi:MAG: hypothetical protein AAGF11_54500 [Myxococcota bacterium]